MSNVLKNNQGQLLLEILIAVGVAATVESTIAENLAQEEFKAVGAIAFSKWQNLYNLTKASSSHYFATSTTGDWATSTGDEVIILNGLSFTRYFTIANVCRDDVSRAIITTVGVPPCVAGNSDDPSTQKITVTVSWSGGTPAPARLPVRPPIMKARPTLIPAFRGASSCRLIEESHNA
jgi:hypothetical protein